MSASDALSAVTTLHSIVSKVKENKTELLRLSNRIRHVVLSLEDSRRRDVIRDTDYNDALTAISDVILRTERLTQRLLKRSLGDRTWNSREISSEIRRLNEDVKNYLSVHTISALDIMQSSQSEQYSMLLASIEEITIKLAELDLRLRPRGGDSWAPNIVAQAQTNQSEAWERLMDFSGIPSTEIPYEGIAFKAMKESAWTTIKIEDLKPKNDPQKPSTLILDVKIDTSYYKLRQLIKDAGYSRPDSLVEGSRRKLCISVVDGDSSYDATSPGGLQISRTEPLRWWYNKYAEYHGISGASTPGQTIAKLDLISGGIWAGGTHFQFHRTLRVPESSNQTPSQLPPDLGQYPLLPISNLEEARLPVSMRGKGGFIMPMFNKEALWISFGGSSGNAVKVSVGGVNVVSGSFYKALTPLAIEQDYLITGPQTRLDGIVAGPGVVRQFVASTVGNGYTVEEQVTGKADVGGLQCDIFRRRDFGSTFSLRSPFQDLDDLKTLQELDIPVQSQVLLSPNKCSVFLGKNWTPREYYRQSTSPSITLRAEYVQIQDFFRAELSSASLGLAAGGPIDSCLISQFPRWSFDVPKPSQLGASAGGEIDQRIWRDETARNTRLYDEEHGHRLYIHIVSPEMWENITGAAPPISPITREMYHRHNIPWFSSYQDREAHVDTVSNVLAKLKSVTQLDEERTGIVLNQNNYSIREEVINFPLDRVAPLHSCLS
ncbi:hypothetical protein DFH08DRAFT_858741 [Mycena albidolilacea]|uniref:Uncharacterized protein n=1 Tax=Mycena albidolilacea TaxID=1033008 RepID=A0AAD7A922_9AGAR|nr:hypothetical protein DFH08DRAFT_858741 [Mycena albidolilacea]